ncbi:MAG: hypothetical protein JKY27_00385 [Magnetovibrio sp.]|nr:hypothetical protein [Magnetovibrio sp.]
MVWSSGLCKAVGLFVVGSLALAACTGVPDGGSGRGAVDADVAVNVGSEPDWPKCKKDTSRIQIHAKSELDLGPLSFKYTSHDVDGGGKERDWIYQESKWVAADQKLYFYVCATNVHKDKDRKVIAQRFKLRTQDPTTGEIITTHTMWSWHNSSFSQLNLAFCGDITFDAYKNTAGESAVVPTCFGRSTNKYWFVGGNNDPDGKGKTDFYQRRTWSPTQNAEICATKADYRNSEGDGLVFCLDGQNDTQKFSGKDGGAHPNNVHIKTPKVSVTLSDADKEKIAVAVANANGMPKDAIKKMIPTTIKSPTWEFNCSDDSPYCTDRNENYQITGQQPWAGVATRGGTKSNSPSNKFDGMDTLTLAATAGHDNTKNTAEWYRTKTGGTGHEVGAGVSEQKPYNNMNFGFCGNFKPSNQLSGKGPELCLGQNHALRSGLIPGDEWWAGGKGFVASDPIPVKNLVEHLLDGYVSELFIKDPQLWLIVATVVKIIEDTGGTNVEATYMYSKEDNLFILALDNTSANPISGYENTNIFNKTFFAFGLGIK